MSREKKSELLHDAIGFIDEDLLREVESLRDGVVVEESQSKNVPIKRTWIRWTALAASICLLISGGMLYKNLLQPVENGENLEGESLVLEDDFTGANLEGEASGSGVHDASTAEGFTNNEEESVGGYAGTEQDYTVQIGGIGQEISISCYTFIEYVRDCIDEIGIKK